MNKPSSISKINLQIIFSALAIFALGTGSYIFLTFHQGIILSHFRIFPWIWFGILLANLALNMPWSAEWIEYSYYKFLWARSRTMRDQKNHHEHWKLAAFVQNGSIGLGGLLISINLFFSALYNLITLENWVPYLIFHIVIFPIFWFMTMLKLAMFIANRQ